MANLSPTEDRPVLVLTYAKAWFKDIFNFPSRSLESKAEVVEYFVGGVSEGEGVDPWADCESVSVDPSNSELTFAPSSPLTTLVVAAGACKTTEMRSQLVRLKRLHPSSIRWILSPEDNVDANGEFAEMGEVAVAVKKSLFVHGALPNVDAKKKLPEVLQTLQPSSAEVEVTKELINFMQKNKITRVFSSVSASRGQISSSKGKVR